MSKSKWIYKNLKNPEFNLLAEKFGVHPAIIKILADRGVQGEDAVREYLEADIATVSNGSELTDMQRGVNIVYDAVQAGKYIRIMGDYDVDGVSSTYILYKGLTGLGAKCDKFIPHRITDGYGLHEPAIRDAYDAGVQVILTCDNGIAAANEVKLAKELGMTVVVTDHHEVPYEIRNFCPTEDNEEANASERMTEVMRFLTKHQPNPEIMKALATTSSLTPTRSLTRNVLKMTAFSKKFAALLLPGNLCGACIENSEKKMNSTIPIFLKLHLSALSAM